MSLPPLKFTLADAEAAADEWGCNRGPSAVAAICGLSLAELRPHLGDFESKRYTNPALMWEILRSLGRGYHVEWRTAGRSHLAWPCWGLARVQWEGPWTQAGVPAAARYRHTHWVGVFGAERKNIAIRDVNALNNGSGWCCLESWERTLVPFITGSIPRANGGWHLTHAVDVYAAQGAG